MAVLFAFAGPESVLVVLAGELTTGSDNGALRAQLAGTRFSSCTCLGALGLRGKNKAVRPLHIAKSVQWLDDVAEVMLAVVGDSRSVICIPSQFVFRQ